LVGQVRHAVLKYPALQVRQLKRLAGLRSGILKGIAKAKINAFKCLYIIISFIVCLSLTNYIWIRCMEILIDFSLLTIASCIKRTIRDCQEECVSFKIIYCWFWLRLYVFNNINEFVIKSIKKIVFSLSKTTHVYTVSPHQIVTLIKSSSTSWIPIIITILIRAIN